ncbi:MAG: YicC/YloC family endoribonuclease [Breznakibacter sp.]
MIYSMTGFGKAVCELPNKKVSIEIKSLNSKQLDLNTRIPLIYREKELLLRNEISCRLVRGKIDLSMFVESAMSDKITQINPPIIEEYYQQLLPVARNLGVVDKTDFLRIIMPLPETVKTEIAELDEAEWALVMTAVEKAILHIERFRAQEGNVLEREINQRIGNIRGLLAQVSPLEEERIVKIRARLRESLEELAGNYSVDENRFEQELIFYLEKLDITEEKVRLANHLDYFNETIGDKEPAGKKLGFIAQEIGREINTLGSKANDAAIQRIVIQMKDELEKIKEQILNIL